MDIKIDMKEAQRVFVTLLDEKKQKNALKSAKNAGAAVIRKAAYRTTRFQDYSGTSRDLRKVKATKAFNLRSTLKNNKIGINITPFNKNVSVIAGQHGLAPHAHLVEFGHNSRKNGPVKGRRFMEMAAIDNTTAALAAAEKAFIKNIERQLKKRIR